MGRQLYFCAVVAFIACSHFLEACTNLLVHKSASTDNSNIIAYNADAANFYTTIYHYPAQLHKNGTSRKTYSWDYGTYLGEIPEAAETYNVVGNVNEHGLVVTESTFGGLQELACSRHEGKIDYGSLIWITLQRSKTAREAIESVAFLVSEYGYASTGESLSIADQNEMWILEIIGKGRHEKGAVWVARKVPDGHVSGHANQARITTFPQNDPENTKFSSDVISFARSIGLYDGTDEAFSFSDVYDPVTFDGARFCEARVWSYFSTVMGQEWSDKYLDYASGSNLENRMPLWVLPPAGKKISPQDVMQGMRNHYEGTALDNSGTLFSDVGAESDSLPMRSGSLVWSAPSSKGKSYFNERTIAQSPTGWSIVCQSRANVAKEMAALMWFGIDDSSTSVHFPVYGSVTKVSAGWAGLGPQDGATPPLMTFSLDSAFYAFNLVANWAYSRWSAIYPDVIARILSKEASYFAKVAETDPKIAALLAKGDKAGAVDLMTNFSTEIGDTLLKEWVAFFGELFVKYRDGFVTTANPKIPVCGCDTGNIAYPATWYDRIVADTGDRYLLPADAVNANLKAGKHGKPSIAKKDLRSFN